MTNHEDRKRYQLKDTDKEFSQSVHRWLAQYDEEDDFMRMKPLGLLPDITAQK